MAEAISGGFWKAGKRGRRQSCLAALALCGGMLWPQSQAAPAGILEIREGNTRLRVGDKLQLHAIGSASTASLTGLAWLSSAPTIVSVGPEGLATALAPGSALISVSGGGSSDMVVLAVQPSTPVSLPALPAAPALTHSWLPAALRERPASPPPSEAASARVLAERWIELWLPELPYDRNTVNEVGRYSISSVEDPNYYESVDISARRPVRVQRRSFPERAPFTPPAEAAAQGAATKDGQAGYVMVVYRIFLKAPADRPLVIGKSYRISIDGAVLPAATGPGPARPGSLSVTYTGKDAKELIHANQEALPPVGPKLAYLSLWLGVDGIGNKGWIDFAGELPSWTGNFSVVPEAGGAAVWTGPIARTTNAAEDYYSGSEVYVLDFSAFSKAGRYRISVPGVGLSYPFAIGAEGFNFVAYTVLRGMMHLRDGNHGLNAPEVTRWNRPPAHLDDAIEQSTGLKIDLAGGHMDAGDREKIPLNMALASSYYLVASRLFPEKVEALGESLQIPESGNGIPDYLDEAFYELDELYRMVANTHGEGAMTAWIKPAKGNFEKGIPLEGQSGRIWYDGQYGHFKSATLAVAGALAMAATDPLVIKYSKARHPDRAGNYLKAAVLAWTAYATHEYDNSWWYDDVALNGGAWRLGKHPYSSQLIFAAANLYEATGSQDYLEHLKAEWPSNPMDLVLYGSDAFGLPLQDYLSVALSTRSELPQALKDEARKFVFKVVDSMNALPRGSPVFGVIYQAAVEGAVGWLFSGQRTGFPNLVAWGLTKNEALGNSYRDRVVAVWNYLLGANPLSKSHISGLGDPQNRVRWLVNEIWDYQWRAQAGGGKGWLEAPPGLVVGDIQHGDFPGWFDSAYNAPRTKRMEPSLGATPLFHRHVDGWLVINEASSHTAAAMAAIALPFAK